MQRVPEVLQLPVIIERGRPFSPEPQPSQKFDLILGGISAECSVLKEFSEPRLVLEGKPMHRMNNSAWKKWRVRAGLPSVRVHDLKHTFGYRLRAAGVSFEDRQDLLGHRSDRITTHYSAPDIGRLLEAAEKVAETRIEPVLQAVSHPKSPQSTVLLAHNRV